MRRVLLILACTALLPVLPGAPAYAQTTPETQPRVVVLWLDGTTLGDWTAPALGNFRAFLDEAAIALLSSGVGAGGADIRAMRASAAETIGAGRFGGAAPPYATVPAPALPLTPFGVGIGIASRVPLLISGSRAGEPIDPAPARALGLSGYREAVVADRAFPTRARADVGLIRSLARTGYDGAHLVIVDLADVARVELTFGGNPAARRRWAQRSMRRADGVLGTLRAAVRPGDTLMVIAPSPPVARAADGRRIGAVALAGTGIPRGLLRSASTDHAGFVPSTDIASTVLARLGLPGSGPGRGILAYYGTEGARPLGGSAVRVVADARALERVRALERDLDAAADARRPVTRVLLSAAAALAVLAFLTIVSGRGAPAGRGRLPRGWRDCLATAAIVVLAVPAGLFAGGAFGAPPVIGALLGMAGGLGARAGLGRERGLIAALAASALLPLIDVSLGAFGAARSSLAFPLAWGAGLRSIDANALGIVLGATLVGTGALLDRLERRARAVPVLVLGAAWSAWAFGSSGAGREGGAVLVAVPAMLLMAFAAAGTRPRPRAVAAIAMGTIFVAGAVALTYGPAIWLEGTPLVPLRTVPALARARLDGTLDLLSLTIWPVALVCVAGALALLAARRRQVLDRGLWGRPGLRAALGSSVVAGVIAVPAVRGGLVAATFIALPACLATLAVLVAPER